jgi:hypothetical protein
MTNGMCSGGLLFSIASGMPIPSVLNEGFQFGMLGFPTKSLARMAGIGN